MGLVRKSNSNGLTEAHEMCAKAFIAKSVIKKIIVNELRIYLNCLPQIKPVLKSDAFILLKKITNYSSKKINQMWMKVIFGEYYWKFYEEVFLQTN